MLLLDSDPTGSWTHSQSFVWCPNHYTEAPNIISVAALEIHNHKPTELESKISDNEELTLCRCDICVLVSP